MLGAALSALLHNCRHNSRVCSQWTWYLQKRASHWQTSLMDLRTSLPMRAEPQKRKRVDPKRDQVARERLRKKLKKMERMAPELIPIEDFVGPTKHTAALKLRSPPVLSFEESERRAVLLKTWSLVKQEEHRAETAAIESLLASQAKALEELRLESEELYQAAVHRDPGLLPFESQGPCHTPPVPDYQPPEGRYSDTTKVYTQ